MAKSSNPFKCRDFFIIIIFFFKEQLCLSIPFLVEQIVMHKGGEFFHKSFLVISSLLSSVRDLTFFRLIKGNFELEHLIKLVFCFPSDLILSGI